VEATGHSVSSGSELVFVIETCQNCKGHHWNTRHDEAKYLDFFNRGRFMILCTTLTYLPLLFYFSGYCHNRKDAFRSSPAQPDPQGLLTL
jgi:hypothetical protein